MNCLYVFFPFLRPRPLPPPIAAHVPVPAAQIAQAIAAQAMTGVNIQPNYYPQPSNSNENVGDIWQADERVPVYNYNRKEKMEIKNIISEYVDEINIAEIILDHLTRWNSCEYCTFGLKKNWIKLPCDHYIHTKCFSKINKHCPRCNETMYNCCN